MNWELRNLSIEQIVKILKAFNGAYLDAFAESLEELEPYEKAKERMALAHANGMAAVDEANAKDANNGQPEMAAFGELLPCRSFTQGMEYVSHSDRKYIIEAGWGKTFEGQYSFSFPLDSSLSAEFFELVGQSEKAKIQREYQDAVASWLSEGRK